MSDTKSVMILVRDKTVHIHLGEILKQGNLVIDNARGEAVFSERIVNSYYEVIFLDQPNGKYWVRIDSDRLKIKKSFILK